MLNSEVSELTSTYSGDRGRFEKIAKSPKYTITNDEFANIVACKEAVLRARDFREKAKQAMLNQIRT